VPYVGGITGLILLGLWLFAIFDVIGTDESCCRNLPKSMWLMLVIFLPAIGSISWLILGRPEGAALPVLGVPFGKAPEVPYRTAVRPLGLEDSPRYLGRSQELDRRLDEWLARQGTPDGDALGVEGDLGDGLAAREAELDRREADLRRREAAAQPGADESGSSSDPPSPNPPA